MKRMPAVLLVLVAAAPAAAQQPAARDPLAYVSAGFAFQVPADERLVALHARIDLPLPGHARPWLSAGVWDLTGMGCFDGPCGISGTELAAGIDAVRLGSAARVEPYAGAGLATWYRDNGVLRLAPMVHAGADLRLSRWMALRTELETSSYPEQGAALLLGGGVRVTVPRW